MAERLETKSIARPAFPIPRMSRSVVDPGSEAPMATQFRL